MVITFDKNLGLDILKAFGKTIDKEENIIENSSKKPVLSKEGEKVRFKEFAGIIKGSEVYIKSDIVSLINYIEKRHEFD